MKIGVLTLPFNNNYGGLLQSLALQRILSNRGHEVILINMPSVRKRTFKQAVRKILDDFTFKTKRDRRRLDRISVNMKSFVVENMVTTKFMFDDSDFDSLKELNLDFFVVGSDQVWRFDYTKHRFGRYFFDFLKNTNYKRFSFAASFGIDSWNCSAKDTKHIKELIADFTKISVREESGVQICKSYLDVDAQHVLDPTLYLDQKWYKDLVTGKDLDFNSSKGSILYYMLDIDEDKRSVIEAITAALGGGKSYRAGVKATNVGDFSDQMIYPSVYQWLYDFMSCDFVVTDSFHGCVFAIIFNKPFVVYANRGRGLTRFESVLKSFDLLDRMIFSSNDLEIDQILREIKYSEVRLKLREYGSELDKFLLDLEL